MPDSRPNIIVFMTDDQGYGDLSCMGATDFRTPNLDGLASDGARFTSWYSNSPVCSPSRAALLSGRYPGNAGVRSVLRGYRTATGLPQSTPTIPSLLSEVGYQTRMVGKWHLGLADECRPHSHGFDQWYGFLAGCIDFYSHIFYWGANRGWPGNNPTHDLWDNNEEVWENGEYFTELIARKAGEYVREMAAKSEPFFLYVPFNAPHYPMHAPKKYVDRFPGLPWDRQIMAAMISAVDDAVGSVMNEVDRSGAANNTLTFFTSDNGPSRESRNWLDGSPDPYYGGTAGAFKGHKFSLYEGGIREPAIIHWPGVIPAGQVIDDPIASMDILPSALEAAGVDASALELDGQSILPVAARGETPQERTIFWEMDGQTAVRRGDWKLVLNGQLVEHDEPIADIHLSNVIDDPEEANNLADSMPELAAELKALAEAWRAGIEERWERDYASLEQNIQTYAMI